MRILENKINDAIQQVNRCDGDGYKYKLLSSFRNFLIRRKWQVSDDDFVAEFAFRAYQIAETSKKLALTQSQDDFYSQVGYEKKLWERSLLALNGGIVILIVILFGALYTKDSAWILGGAIVWAALGALIGMISYMNIIGISQVELSPLDKYNESFFQTIVVILLFALGVWFLLYVSIGIEMSLWITIVGTSLLIGVYCLYCGRAYHKLIRTTDTRNNDVLSYLRYVIKMSETFTNNKWVRAAMVEQIRKNFSRFGLSTAQLDSLK